MLAGGGEACSDIEHLPAQETLFGAVPSDSTLYRTFRQITPSTLAGLWEAMAASAPRCGADRAATTGIDTVVLDIDASLHQIHSENKEDAAANYKGGYGFHPIYCFQVRRWACCGPASAGCTDFVSHARARNVGFAVVARSNASIHAAISRVRFDADCWAPALRQDGDQRPGAAATELTERTARTAHPRAGGSFPGSTSDPDRWARLNVKMRRSTCWTTPWEMWAGRPAGPLQSVGAGGAPSQVSRRGTGKCVRAGSALSERRACVGLRPLPQCR